jgi:hypothetical protein
MSGTFFIIKAKVQTRIKRCLIYLHVSPALIPSNNFDPNNLFSARPIVTTGQVDTMVGSLRLLVSTYSRCIPSVLIYSFVSYEVWTPNNTTLSTICSNINHTTTCYVRSSFGGLVVSMLVSGTQDRGFAPGRRCRIFSGEKEREVKPFVPCRRFAACQRTL